MNWYYAVALLVCAILGYLLGSINTSLIVGKFYGVDVREYGSGNAGTTNVLRTLGKKAAAFTFLGDLLKGIIACLLGKYIILSAMAIFGNDIFGNVISPQETGLMAAGAFCVFGHNWPVYFGFKGGKGVLTTFAVLLMMGPLPALITLVFFVLVTAAARYISLSSILSAVFLPLSVYIFSMIGWDMGISSVSRYLLFCIPLSLLIIIRHKKNIVKLINGTENKFSLKKKKGDNVK